MKEIIIYVEGPSDKYGMEALLMEQCPQNFKTFVEDLIKIIGEV